MNQVKDSRVARGGAMNEDRRLRLMRCITMACVLLMLVVTTASAWLRLAQPRPSCADWPSCRSLTGPVLRAQRPELLGDPRTLSLVRAAHRIAASAVLLLVLALTALALTGTLRRRVVAAFALGLLALTLGLASLGVVTAGSRAPAVLLGNLLGGLLTLGLSWGLARRLYAAHAPSPPLARLALAGALLWALQASLGLLAGARLAEAAPWAHMALALVAAPWAFGVGWWAFLGGGRAEGGALVCIAVMQVALGRAAAAWAAAPAAVLLHNVLAAVGIALLLGFALGSVRTLARPAVLPSRQSTFASATMAR